MLAIEAHPDRLTEALTTAGFLDPDDASLAGLDPAAARDRLAAKRT